MSFVRLQRGFNGGRSHFHKIDMKSMASTMEFAAQRRANRYSQAGERYPGAAGGPGEAAIGNRMTSQEFKGGY
jgi:hypothetical protein